MNVLRIAFIMLLVAVNVRAMEKLKFEERAASHPFVVEFPFVHLACDSEMNEDISLKIMVWELLKEQRQTNEFLTTIVNRCQASDLNSEFSNLEESKESRKADRPSNDGRILRKIKKLFFWNH